MMNSDNGGGNYPGGYPSGGPGSHYPGGPGSNYPGGGPSSGGSIYPVGPDNHNYGEPNTGSSSQNLGDASIRDAAGSELILRDSSGNLPPSNYDDLYKLINQRLQNILNRPNASPNSNIAALFPHNDCAVDVMAKQRLLAYILDHKEELGTAYKHATTDGNIP